MASVVDAACEVVSQVFDDAERRDPGHHRTWIALVDSNNHQIERTQGEARARQDVTIVVDFVHVLEDLRKAAWCFYDEGDPDAERWVRDRARAIMKGQATGVAAAIQRKAARQRLDWAARTTIDECGAYVATSVPTSTIPPPWREGGRSPPESSKAPAGTSSRTGWTSPAPGGASTAARPSSRCAPSSVTATSRSTGATTLRTSAACPPFPLCRRDPLPPRTCGLMDCRRRDTGHRGINGTGRFSDEQAPTLDPAPCAVPHPGGAPLVLALDLDAVHEGGTGADGRCPERRSSSASWFDADLNRGVRGGSERR